MTTTFEHPVYRLGRYGFKAAAPAARASAINSQPPSDCPATHPHAQGL